jgi:hypothetical protein
MVQLLLILGLISPILAHAECLSDYRINQSWQPHHLSAKQLRIAERYARNNDPERGWHYIASLGDAYAGLAANVVAPDPNSIGVHFHNFVRQHWVNVAGADATQAHFTGFARQHFRQYVEMLKAGSWPDADQILNSYLTAARSHSLPEMVVFDAAWTASSFSWLISWQILNQLPLGRQIFASRICLRISREAADQVLAWDFGGR